MICPPCRRAGDYNKDPQTTLDSEIHQMHDECLGKGHCDCQHKVGPSHKFIETDKAKNNGS